MIIEKMNVAGCNKPKNYWHKSIGIGNTFQSILFSTALQYCYCYTQYFI